MRHLAVFWPQSQNNKSGLKFVFACQATGLRVSDYWQKKLKVVRKHMKNN